MPKKCKIISRIWVSPLLALCIKKQSNVLYNLIFKGNILQKNILYAISMDCTAMLVTGAPTEKGKCIYLIYTHSECMCGKVVSWVKKVGYHKKNEQCGYDVVGLSVCWKDLLLLTYFPFERKEGRNGIWKGRKKYINAPNHLSQAAAIRFMDGPLIASHMINERHHQHIWSSIGRPTSNETFYHYKV